MKLRLFHVDAFATERFRGNPAAVLVLERFPSDAFMAAVAEENALSETAFVVPAHGTEAGQYHLRWFTPATEVELCGHATLAASWVLVHRFGERSRVIRFATRSGELRTTALVDGLLELDFPARRPLPIVLDGEASDTGAASTQSRIAAALGTVPESVLDSGRWYTAVFARADDVTAIRPDFRAIAALDRHGVLVTAPGNGVDAIRSGRDEPTPDFVSRCFAPSVGIDEDPVTGSAHCDLLPYWAARLGRTELRARQVSRRGGELRCRLDGERVHMAGAVVPYLEGEIDAEDA